MAKGDKLVIDLETLDERLMSGILQDWIQTVNPKNTFDYTPGLLQFV